MHCLDCPLPAATVDQVIDEVEALMAAVSACESAAKRIPSRRPLEELGAIDAAALEHDRFAETAADALPVLLARSCRRLEAIAARLIAADLSGSTPPANEPERALDSIDAAALLRLHPVTLRRMTAAGKLPARKVGREWRYTRSSLLEWVAGAAAPNPVAGPAVATTSAPRTAGTAAKASKPLSVAQAFTAAARGLRGESQAGIPPSLTGSGIRVKRRPAGS